MAITRELWTFTLIEACEAIADSKMQEERWLAPDARAWERPEELICVLWDDIQLGLFIEEYAATFSDGQAKAVLDLRDRLNRFDEEKPGRLDPREILSNPRWEMVRSTARAVVCAVRTQT